MTYGHLQADCLYTGITSGPNARCRVWETFTFTFFYACCIVCGCVCVCVFVVSALLPAAVDSRVVRLLVGLVAAHSSRHPHLPTCSHPRHHPLLPRTHVRLHSQRRRVCLTPNSITLSSWRTRSRRPASELDSVTEFGLSRTIQLASSSLAAR